MSDSEEPGGARWSYTWTWCRDTGEEDEPRVTEMLDKWAAKGWELVSANAVWVMSVGTDAQMGIGITYSKGWVRHYFYWKKPVTS